MAPPNINAMEIIYTIVKRQPGHTKYTYAKLIGMAYTSFNQRLIAMENQGFLFAEDDAGALYPFKEPGQTQPLRQ